MHWKLIGIAALIILSPLTASAAPASVKLDDRQEQLKPLRGGQMQKVTYDISAEVTNRSYIGNKISINVYLYKKQYVPVSPPTVPLKGQIIFDSPEGEQSQDLEFSSKGDHYNARIELKQEITDYKLVLTFTVEGVEEKLNFDIKKQ